MGAVVHERVEFLDLLACPDADASRSVDPAVDPAVGPVAGRAGWRPVVLAATVVAGVLVGARALGAPPPAPPTAAALAPVYGGEVTLPAGFGAPVRLASAAAVDADVLWALGANGQVVRVVDGGVTALSAARGYHALAVRPDARTVYVSTGRFAPSVVALDPVTLEPRGSVLAAAPVTALAAGVGTVWAGSAAGVQGWTADLRQPLPVMVQASGVTAVRTLAVVEAGLQALVTTAARCTALLRLTPPGGAPQLSTAFAGPVSLVPGIPALLAHPGPASTVEVTDPTRPTGRPLARPLTPDSSIWPALRSGTARWLASSRASAGLECFDTTGELVGRTSVGDAGRGVRGPVVTTARAVYAVTVDGGLARGGHGSCGGAPDV